MCGCLLVGGVGCAIGCDGICGPWCVAPIGIRGTVGGTPLVAAPTAGAPVGVELTTVRDDDEGEGDGIDFE